MKNALKSLPLAVAAAALMATAPLPAGSVFGPEVAAAQDDGSEKKKTRKVPALGSDFYKKVQKGQEKSDEKLFAEAKEILNDAINRRGTNDYEKAVGYQVLATIAFEEEQPLEAIRLFELILELRESIPEAQEVGILFNVSQLWFQQEDYKKSLSYAQEWETKAEVVGVNQLVFISQIHYQLSNYQEAVNYVERAIRDAESAGLEVKENWYSIVLSAYWELGNFPKVRDTLETLLINWPKPIYWTQLAGVYGELGEDQKSFSLTEAAYKQGFLNDNPGRLVNHAQILLSRQAPIKAAWVLQDALDEGLIEDKAANQRLLGQAYLLASEYRKAIDPLSAAAKEEADGDLWFQIGQVLTQLDRHAEAADAYASAIKAFAEEGDKKSQLSATMSRGTAFTELKRFKEAKEEFAKARRIASTDKDRRTVRQWVEYLNAEEAREKILAGTG